jgi:hypothetical protein
MIKAAKLIAGWLFRHEIYYMYMNVFPEINEVDVVPNEENVSVYFVSSNNEADELAKKLPDFRAYSIYSAKRLDKGAIACCLYVREEFAHVGWIALNRESQEFITPYPYSVDFENKEACTGGAYTVSRFQGKGLYRYGHYRRLKYLRNKGIETIWDIVDSSNTAVLKVKVEFSQKKYAKARFTKIFGLKFWNKTLLE